jgi:hypothetical protein
MRGGPVGGAGGWLPARQLAASWGGVAKALSPRNYKSAGSHALKIDANVLPNGWAT